MDTEEIGIYFINNNIYTYFLDNDNDILNYLKNKKELNSKFNKYAIIKKLNLMNNKWPFIKESLSGIINVHFYNKYLIPKFIDSLKPNGFLYIETIKASKGNLYLLPEYKNIYNELVNNNFKILFYKEHKKIILNKPNVASLKIFAIKNKLV